MDVPPIPSSEAHLAKRNTRYFLNQENPFKYDDAQTEKEKTRRVWSRILSLVYGFPVYTIIKT